MLQNKNRVSEEYFNGLFICFNARLRLLLNNDLYKCIHKQELNIAQFMNRKKLGTTVIWAGHSEEGRK